MPRVQTLTACGPIGGRGAVRIVGPTTGIHRLVGSKNWATQQLPTGSRQDSVVVPDNADRPKLHRAQGAKRRYYSVTALHQEKLTLSRLRSCCSGHSWWVSGPCGASSRNNRSTNLELSPLASKSRSLAMVGSQGIQLAGDARRWAKELSARQLC